MSPVATRTLSSASPNVSAAIATNAFSMPLMSAAAVITVSLPSESSLQIAAAGSRPPGQKPSATPDALAVGQLAAALPQRVLAHALEALARRRRLDLLPVDAASPATSTLCSRSSIGSRSSSAASRSISVSTANAAGGAPGAR